MIGAGHAGLAMSCCLAERSVDHVVLEQGEVDHTWRTERWDSLWLLTPNWQSRLPSFSYSGPDPDGYRTLPEVIDLVTTYAKTISAPVRTHTTVTSVRSTETGYLVRTDQGDSLCRAVVLASGAFSIACIPSFADRVIKHDGGIVWCPGVYLMGTPFQRCRKSTLIDGAGDDACDLSDHLVSYLHGRPQPLSRLG